MQGRGPRALGLRGDLRVMGAPGSWWRDGIVPLLGLMLLKLLVSAALLAQGVTAISDDDFARVVIAQSFAEAPSLDPSGTSWLPLPFWVYGAPLALLGDSWQVARGVAVALGVLSVWLVWGAARLFGAGARGALAGAAVAALFPYGAWLGVATVPELPTASLTLFALGCGARVCELLRQEATGRRPPSRVPWLFALLGALALTAGCASRYEVWPVAAGFALGSLWDARASLRTIRPRSAAGLARPSPEVPGAFAWLLVALVAISFPCAWLLHGQVRHGDPLFFVRRVTEYKQALGGAQGSLVELLLTYPIAFLRGEPELVFGAAALLAIAKTSLTWRRTALLLTAMLLVLIAGDLRGGGPTHHPERALLTGWLFAAILAGDALTRTVHQLTCVGATRVRRWLVACATLVVLVGGHGVRRPDLTTASFRQRAPELAAGRLLRDLASPDEPVVVATDDYGYFAVLATLGAPGRSHVLDDNDPRQPSPGAGRLERLHGLVSATGSRWAVFPRSWSPDPALGQEMAEGGPIAVRLVPREAGENSPREAQLH